MNLGDVFAVLATLLGLGIALPGLLLAWSLILPGTVARAQLRLRHTPLRCFGLGGVWLAASVVPIVVLLNVKAGPAQFAGFALIFILLTFASIGAAGLAALMGERLRGGGLAASTHGALLRGAMAMELAGVFPIIGWFIVIPLITVTALGAAGFALLHWMPRSTLPSPSQGEGLGVRVEAAHAAHAS